MSGIEPYTEDRLYVNVALQRKKASEALRRLMSKVDWTWSRRGGRESAVNAMDKNQACLENRY